MIGNLIMQLELSFLFLKKRFKVHWDNGWVTSNQDRFFDVESAARFECVSYLNLTGKSPDDYKKQLTTATASARDRATIGLFGR